MLSSSPSRINSTARNQVVSGMVERWNAVCAVTSIEAPQD
jgi:hypothetical protein